MRPIIRSLVFIFVSFLFLFALLRRSDGLSQRAPTEIARRQLPPPRVPDPPTTTDTSTTPTTTPSSTSTSTTTSVESSTTTSASPTTSAPPVATSAPVSSAQPTDQTSDTGIPTVIQSTATVVVSEDNTPSSTSSAPASNTSSDSGGGIGTGTIIGLSVAGGLAVLGIVGFFVWKLTRKRFSDFDDNEAIKWPELNAHGSDIHSLPVNNTGRAGFETGSEASLSRVPSMSAGGAPDPYAVPPLPHLNPNQPYRDEPSPAPYYDPYRGPVPNTFSDTASVDVPPTGWTNAEAIPMTQMAPGRSRSPGPQMAYDGSPAPGMAGRRSPGPYAAYDGRTGSPAPGMGGSPVGRRSPGPQAAYDPPGYGTS